jgi:transcriptional regulator with XRE-family HTH domain
MTQADVAERIGVARTNYVVYETGRQSPNAAHLAAIASAVGVDPRALTTTTADQVTLRDLREYAGLTHQQLAAKLGYSAARSYRDIELGHKELAPAVARLLARALRTNLAEVWAAWERTTGEQR